MRNLKNKMKVAKNEAGNFLNNVEENIEKNKKLKEQENKIEAGIRELWNLGEKKTKNKKTHKKSNSLPKNGGLGQQAHTLFSGAQQLNNDQKTKNVSNNAKDHSPDANKGAPNLLKNTEKLNEELDRKKEEKEEEFLHNAKRYLEKKGKKLLNEGKNIIKNDLPKIVKDDLDKLLDDLNFKDLKALMKQVKGKLAIHNDSALVVTDPYKDMNLSEKDPRFQERRVIKNCFALNALIYEGEPSKGGLSKYNKSEKTRKHDVIKKMLDDCKDIREFMLYFQTVYDNEKILNKHKHETIDRFFGIANTDSWKGLLTVLKAKGKELLDDAVSTISKKEGYFTLKAIQELAIESPITTAHRNNHWVQGAFGKTATTKVLEKLIVFNDSKFKKQFKQVPEARSKIPVFGRR